MTNETTRRHPNATGAIVNRAAAKRIFTLILLFMTVQAWGQERVFRPEPNFNSQPSDTVTSGAGYRYILGYTKDGWVKVQRRNRVAKHDKNGKYLGSKQVDVVEYIDLESLNPYVLKKRKEIHLHSKPEINSPVVLNISHIGMFDIWKEEGSFPDNDKRNDLYRISKTQYQAVGSVNREWVRIHAIIEKERLNYKDYRTMTAAERVEYGQKYTEDTISGYVDRQSFETNMELIPVHVPSLKEKISDYTSGISYDIENFFEYRMNLNKNFHMWILVLLGLNLIALVALDALPRVQFILDYGSLQLVFILELIYIVMLENKFWWCSPDRVGWIKAILFFLLTLALAVYQFFRFFHMLDQIKERSKPFNTWTGITLFTLVTVVMFIYAIFAGGLDNEQNRTLINILIGTQVLQALITTIQLRKYPLYAVMTLLLIPLGTFAVLLSFLRLFALLCLFGLLAFTAFCWAASSSDDGSGGGKSRGRGDAQHCPYCNYPYCDFITGGRSRCSLINSDSCKHGQR